MGNFAFTERNMKSKSEPFYLSVENAGRPKPWNIDFVKQGTQK